VTSTGLPNSESGSPPPLPQQLQNAIAAAGEHIVGAYQDPTGGYIYLGSNGGIFNEDGSNYYGSYTGLTPNQQVQKPGTATGLNLSPNGGYTEVFSSGATYAFGPNTNTQGQPISR
jgi:hypothetical protein